MQKRFPQTLHRRRRKDARRGEQAAKRGQLGRACFTAAAVATGLVGATVALADDDDHWRKRKRHHHSPPYYVVAPPVAYYAPRPIVYAPPPVVYYPAPMAYAPAYPAYPAYGPPVGSLNLGVTLPLR